ncbi:MAG: hypothetical protein SFY80_10220 [Verrucomicrobiota bacterium]|nr:hypothetical protein [Verrucomicrobiota bacterium]
MPVAYTSRVSYLAVQNGLNRSRRRVWEAIRDWTPSFNDTEQPGPTIEDLAKLTGMKECAICGRVNELREDYGAIEDGPTWTNRTGKHAKTYRAIVYKSEPPKPIPTPFRCYQTGQGILFEV